MILVHIIRMNHYNYILLCFLSLLLMFRYYHRLLKIESENNKSLQKSWNKTMLNIKQKMNISSLDISNTEFSIQVRHFFLKQND